MPEVVFGLGKTAPQITEIVKALQGAGQSALATRVEPEVAEKVLAEIPGGDYERASRLLWFGDAEVPIVGKGRVAVVSAGTADPPAAAEAVGVSRRFGNETEWLKDVGVAGLHRLLSSVEALREARILIVVAVHMMATPLKPASRHLQYVQYV